MSGGILALDLASKTGWAHAGPAALDVWPASALEAAGKPVPAFDVGTQTFEGSAVLIGKFAFAFDFWLFHLVKRYEPWLVCFEAPYVGPKTSQAMARKLMGLAWHVEFLCACWERAILCQEASSTDVRKHFTGRGSGKREQMKQMALSGCFQRRWLVADDDEADAMALLDYAVACHWQHRRAAC